MQAFNPVAPCQRVAQPRNPLPSFSQFGVNKSQSPPFHVPRVSRHFSTSYSQPGCWRIKGIGTSPTSSQRGLCCSMETVEHPPLGAGGHARPARLLAPPPCSGSSPADRHTEAHKLFTSCFPLKIERQSTRSTTNGCFCRAAIHRPSLAAAAKMEQLMEHIPCPDTGTVLEGGELPHQ